MNWVERYFDGCEEWMDKQGHWLDITPKGLPPGPDPPKLRWKRASRQARIARRLLETPEMLERIKRAYIQALLYGNGYERA